MKAQQYLQPNYRDSRSTKARFAKHLDKTSYRVLLWLCAFIALLFWGLLFYFEVYLMAHFTALFVSVTTVPLIWYYGELKNLAIEADLNASDDLAKYTDRNLLAVLKPNLSPKQLSQVVTKTPGAYFYATRYGITMDILSLGLSENPADAEIVWKDALALARYLKSEEISSHILTASLIRVVPGTDDMLAVLNVEQEDIIKGLKWNMYSKRIYKELRDRRKRGGIGRDLSFGWAPMLNNFGHNITASVETNGVLHRPVASHEEVVDQMIHVLSQPGRRNAVLVGEVGVGKTTLAYAFANRLLEKPETVPDVLRYNQLIKLEPANLIANAKGRGQIEELMIRLFNEAGSVKNIILFLDNAELFLQDGTGSMDLSSLLLPVLEGGGIRLILSLDEQAWLKLSQTSPGFAQLLNRIIVKQLEEKETMLVVEDQLIELEARYGVIYMYRSLSEAYKLADRYIREQAMPGKAIKLLEAASGFVENQYFITAKSVQLAVEKSFDVKVQTASTTEEKDVLLNLEDRIHERMINQTRAVKLVSDALRRARAGVRNENRPIGTFLFLGPTGVGKTELSKALADVYFGGEDRMVRVDLNEFSQPSDTNRLLAVAADDPYSLAAQIIKQPFSVVLLDEIEKAHDNVLNMLLQMLDEGILRDSANKPVSFRDAIIVATSNAGADKIRQHIDKGEKLEDFEEQFTNELIDSNQFRPEFLNRFDEIVLFRPLEGKELLQIVDLQIAQLNKRLSAQKIAVSLTEEAKQLLVSAGFDARLGARPLRRTVQRAVENLVAQVMLQDKVTPGQTITFDAPDIQSALDSRQ
jgi:ATP-dependent Clp protease ATP-binding subunit ClpC